MSELGFDGSGNETVHGLVSALDRKQFSFPTQRIGGARLPIRPLPNVMQRDYVAFLGSDDTYGCHLSYPFTDLIEDETGIQTINLGCVGARIDAFQQNEGILEMCRGARLVFIEAVGAEAMSNRLYRVDVRNNQRLIRVTKYLKALYEGVDFSGIETVGELLTVLAQMSEEKLYFVRLELHMAWVARMKTLIKQIGVPVILLWLADHEPFYAAKGGTIFRDPLFVDRTMIEALRQEVVDIIEITASKDEVFSTGADAKEPTSMPIGSLGPGYHERVAAELSPVIQAAMRALASVEPPPATDAAGAAAVPL